MKKSYWAELHWKNKHAEKIMRKFLLKNSTSVKFANKPFIDGLFFRKVYCTNKDPLFRKVEKQLKPFFVKKQVRTRKGFIFRWKNIRTNYYEYKLTHELKQIIDKETLFWCTMPPNKTSNFYGFEDPVFYKNGKLVAKVMSLDRYVNLRLSRDEKRFLEKKGIELIKEE